MQTFGYNVIWWMKNDPALVDRVVCNMSVLDDLSEAQVRQRKVFASDWRDRMDMHPDLLFRYSADDLEKILSIDCSKYDEPEFKVEQVVRYWLWAKTKVKKHRGKSRVFSKFYQYCNLGVSTPKRRIIADLAKEACEEALGKVIIW